MNSLEIKKTNFAIQNKVQAAIVMNKQHEIVVIVWMVNAHFLVGLVKYFYSYE